MKSETDEWPFDQPRNCAVMTQRQIMNGSKPILLVCHDSEDHGWQFLDGDPISMKDALVACLQEVVKIDPSVFQVANLLPGWQALRKNVTTSWQCQLDLQTS
jgi:hypothetical protein